MSSLRLQVTEAENCLATAYDPVFGHGYLPLDCDVDNYQDAEDDGLRLRRGWHPRLRCARHQASARDRLTTSFLPWVPSLARGHPIRHSSKFPESPLFSSKHHTADAVDYARFMDDAHEIWLHELRQRVPGPEVLGRFVAGEESLHPKKTCYGGMAAARLSVAAHHHQARIMPRRSDASHERQKLRGSLLRAPRSASGVAREAVSSGSTPRWTRGSACDIATRCC